MYQPSDLYWNPKLDLPLDRLQLISCSLSRNSFHDNWQHWLPNRNAKLYLESVTMKKSLILCLLLGSVSLQACSLVSKLGSAGSGASKLGSAGSGASKLGSAGSGASKLGSAGSGTSKLGSAGSGTSKLGLAGSGTSKLGSAAAISGEASASSKVGEISDTSGAAASETRIINPKRLQVSSQANAYRQLQKAEHHNKRSQSPIFVYEMNFTNEEKMLIALSRIDELHVEKQNIYYGSLKATLHHMEKNHTEISIEIAKGIAKSELRYYCYQNGLVVDESTADLLAFSIGTAAYTAYSDNNSSSGNSG
jgi:hypothetical protein